MFSLIKARKTFGSLADFFQCTAGEIIANNKSGDWNIILPLKIDNNDDENVDQDILHSIISRLNQD